MSGEIDLIIDGHGLAIIGTSSDVERFLLSAGLDKAPSRNLDLHRVSGTANLLGGGGAAAAAVAQTAGRWVELTPESAHFFKSAPMMKGPADGISRAIAINGKGKTEHILQIVSRPGSMLTNPAFLSGIGAVMSQYAMQQQMDEIVEYLESINEKVDDILRGQKDAVLADMIGVDLIIEDALIVRDQVGHVSDLTWSKVQATSQTLARTQAYALRELDAVAEKLQKKADAGDIARAAADAEPKIREWLAVLARTFQLQDGLSVLELDRVFNASPDELDSHHTGLLKARENRLNRINRSTSALLAQMDRIIEKANARVLLNPFDSPAAVRSSSHVATEVRTIRALLGIESEHETTDAKRWGRAAGEAMHRVRTNAVEGVGAARRFGEQTVDRATAALRSGDTDGNGTIEKSPAVGAAEQASSAVRGAAAGAAGAVSNIFRRKSGRDHSSNAADDAPSPDSRSSD